jgi:hypothetical protein
MGDASIAGRVDSQRHKLAGRSSVADEPPTRRGISDWVLAGALLFAVFGVAQAAGEPPGRVGRLSRVEGQVWLYDNEQAVWLQAQRNWPISNGDRLNTDAASRAEIGLGSTTLRIGPDSDVEATQLDDDRIEWQVHDGSVALRVRSAEAAREIGVTTTEGRFEPDGVGSFRIDRRGDATEVTAWRGVLRFQGADRSLTIPPGRRARLVLEGPWRSTRLAWLRNEVDDFAEWVLREDARDPDRPRSGGAAAWVSTEMTGWEDLDRFGRWEQHRDAGMVWVPEGVDADWAPYRYGQWVYARPWGWTWVDDAPWGFAPFHFGRWLFAAGRWCWAPGEYVHRPAFSPALVGFVGSAPHWQAGDHRPPPPVAWVPLAPGEHFRPWQPTRTAPPLPGRERGRGDERDRAREPGRDGGRPVEGPAPDRRLPGRGSPSQPPAGYINQTVNGAVTQVPAEDAPWRWPAPRTRNERLKARVDGDEPARTGAPPVRQPGAGSEATPSRGLHAPVPPGLAGSAAAIRSQAPADPPPLPAIGGGPGWRGPAPAVQKPSAPAATGAMPTPGPSPRADSVPAPPRPDPGPPGRTFRGEGRPSSTPSMTAPVAQPVVVPVGPPSAPIRGDARPARGVAPASAAAVPVPVEPQRPPSAATFGRTVPPPATVSPAPVVAPGRQPAASSTPDAGAAHQGRRSPGAQVPEARASEGRAIERGASR